MVVLNYTGEEINAKIVYYGPGLSGKTTNLEQLYGQMPANSKGQMVSMKTRTDRTLFFDFFPLELGEINGYRTRFLLYTVPGQVYYNATRKLVLKGADAVVFVADSAADKLQENIESLRNLEDNLNEHGLSLDNIPWIIQYNKRDLPNCMPVAELHQHLNLMNVPAYEATAMTGVGVYDTFKEVAGLLYRELKERLESGNVIASSGAPGEETIPRPPGEQQPDVNTAIDSALQELEGASQPLSQANSSSRDALQPPSQAHVSSRDALQPATVVPPVAPAATPVQPEPSVSPVAPPPVVPVPVVPAPVAQAVENPIPGPAQPAPPSPSQVTAHVLQGVAPQSDQSHVDKDASPPPSQAHGGSGQAQPSASHQEAPAEADVWDIPQPLSRSYGRSGEAQPSASHPPSQAHGSSGDASHPEAPAKRDVWDIPQPEIQSQSGERKTSQSHSLSRGSSRDAQPSASHTQGAQTSNAADDGPTSRPQAQKDMGNTSNTDHPFKFVPEEQETSPDVGRLVELDEPPVEPAVEGDSHEFITDPMQRASAEQPVEIEPEEAPVVTERKTEPTEQELVVPVVVSRSQVRKTIPLKIRLEIRVVDD